MNKENNKILSVINKKERQLLVHSNLYYKHDKNLISDRKYDDISFSLNSLIRKYPCIFKKSQYYKDFIGFDPSSEYYLNYDKPEVDKVVNILLKNTN